jgi:hypothetical protein
MDIEAYLDKERGAFHSPLMKALKLFGIDGKRRREKCRTGKMSKKKKEKVENTNSEYLIGG